jgi:8-oxo-dGTP pyrophosphatase MutT (NUDIX family)
MPSERDPARDDSALFVVSVAVVVVQGERALALRRAPHKTSAGVWESVSGRVAHGETLEAACARELVEETGLSASRLLGPVDAYVMDRAGAPMCVVVYRADVSGEVVRSHEHDAEAWWTMAECRAGMPPRLADAVERALAARGGPLAF